MWVYNLPFGAKLVIDVQSASAMAVLTERAKALRDTRPLTEAIAVILRKSLGDQFSKGGNPIWVPLAPSTVAAKRALGLPSRTSKGNIPRRLMQRGQFGPGGILIASGALRDSYRRKGAKGHFEETTNTTVRVGSRLPYAIFHQKGTRAYIIRARFQHLKRSLMFVGSGGQTVFARTVHHPGLPKRAVGVQPDDKMQIQNAVRLHFIGQRTA